ncbi:hypothetical protein WI372_00105 [Gemmatimonadota bacterium DH-20]|uniref:Outer membrane protein beta-barrel domain-containing protein n=1 Tax=Gaopeijia maritima TaxID=3119007 RepID=A0ABU9E3W0_9BACT
MKLRRTLLALASLGVAMAPAMASAQSNGDGFLFRAPKVQIGVRLGYAGAAAQSAVFDDAQNFFTLDRSDFGGGLFGAEIAVRVSERMDVALAFSNSSSRVLSEYRDWVGEDDLPIQQETTFTRQPFTASMKYYFADRGRSVSRFAWIPNRFAPYLGAGVGLMRYEFAQEGEFVDFVDYAIFPSRFESDGTAGTAHLLGGIETSITPRMVMNLEGRYEWASHDMGVDWQGYDPIDLSGFQVSVGLGVRF